MGNLQRPKHAYLEKHRNTMETGADCAVRTLVIERLRNGHGRLVRRRFADRPQIQPSIVVIADSIL